MLLKTASYSEIKIYLGSVRHYHGRPFTEHDLITEIGRFQVDWNHDHEWTCALRITPTTFVCMEYQEKGWEIGCINYPRFPQKHSDLLDFMRTLVRHLLKTFEQQRITLIEQSSDYANDIEMYEAQEKPK